jgi:hypothetical protein
MSSDTDIMVDVRDGLVVFRVAGVWQFTSRSNQTADAVVKELQNQAVRLESRAGLLREAAAYLRAEPSR